MRLSRPCRAICTSYQSKRKIWEFKKITSVRLCLRREGDEELEQVQLRMLREGDDDPERRVEVVDVDEERRVLLQTEDEVVLRKPVLEHGAVLVQEDLLLFPLLAAGRSVADSQIHL